MGTEYQFSTPSQLGLENLAEGGPARALFDRGQHLRMAWMEVRKGSGNSKEITFSTTGSSIELSLYKLYSSVHTAAL